MFIAFYVHDRLIRVSLGKVVYSYLYVLLYALCVYCLVKWI